MKHLFYKSFFLFIAFTGTICAQKYTPYQKSYDSDKNTTLHLNLKNTTIGIERSDDGKIHFEYSLEFKNYSKKGINEIIDGIHVESAKVQNNIKLNATSISKLYKVGYAFKTNKKFVFESDISIKPKPSEKKEYRKSKDSILTEINDKGISGLNNLLKKFKIRDKEGKKRKVNTKNVQIKRSMFTIKVPPFVNIIIKGKDSHITFLDNSRSKTSVKLDGGFLRTKSINNQENNISISNAVFEATEISGGTYILNNVSKCLIGQASNLTLEAEVSKVEIGEVSSNLKIKDFNSEFYFYDFSSNFKPFDFKSEYSKVHFFEPELGYVLKVFGKNTVFHIGDIETKVGPKKDDNIMDLMLKIKRRPKMRSSGDFDFEMIHGIFYANLTPDEEKKKP